MTTSGTSAFNLSFDEIVEESFERIGGRELRTGYDLRTARRSMNLLLAEMSNRGINLWTVEQGSIPMVTGQATYTLPVDTVDLLDHVVRTGTGQNQIDISITRIAEPTYSTIPNKNAQGRPIQVWIQRMTGAQYPLPGPAGTDPVTGINAPKITVWPTPNAPGDQYTFVYWRLRRMQDVNGAVNTLDIPFRFLNCMVAGLAYYLSMKLPDVPGDRIMALKADYMEQLDLATQEDREKAPIRLVPRVMR
jgi:hypothetical protein